MQGWIRAFCRFFYFITSTVIHITGFAVVVLLGKPKKSAASRLRRKWLSHVPAEMGIRLNVEGKPYHGPCLYVANHIGYLDPILIWKQVEANVVAKAEVKRWPLVGLGGYVIGTIFVNRDKKSSRVKTANIIRKALEDGVSILVFPEGTTTDGHGILPFKPRSFEAAFLAGVPVQPIFIRYENAEAAFIDDDTFIPHFFRLFRLHQIKVTLIFGPLLTGDNTCREAQDWIKSILSPFSMKVV